MPPVWQTVLIAVLAGFAGALGTFVLMRAHKWLDAHAEAKRRRRLLVKFSVEKHEVMGHETNVGLPEGFFLDDKMGQAIPRTARLFVVRGANADHVPVMITGVNLESSRWRWPWIVAEQTRMLGAHQALKPSETFRYRAHVDLFAKIFPAERRWWVRAVMEDSTGGRHVSRPVRFG